MVGRIVEIADDRRHLFVHRGFMVVKDTEGERKELGQVPLDDIAAVIANAHGLTYTNNLLVALAERGAPFVLCGANHNAIGMLLTLDGHHVQAKRIEARFPDPMGNPYLTFVALLMAGLDGIINQIDPGAAQDKNLYDLPPREQKKVPEVCGSLREALENLDKDRAFLKAGGVMDDDFIDAYIELKMQEVMRLQLHPHPVEFDMYFAC